MDLSDHEDWQSAHFKSRHINHNHSRSKGAGRSGRSGGGWGRHGSTFKPQSSYGVYEVMCPALAKLGMGPLVTHGAGLGTSPGGLDSPSSMIAGSPVLSSSPETWSAAGGLSPGFEPGSPGGKKMKKGKGKGNSRRPSKEDRIIAAVGRGGSGAGAAVSAIGNEARFEIHGDVEGDGNEGALMCSFDLGGVIHGVGVLAGSRRLLGRVVRELAGENDDDEGTEAMEMESVASTVYDSDGEEVQIENGIEEADQRERRRLAAFEKNTFRVPKFWLRWKGYVNGGSVSGAADLAVGDANGEQLFKTKSGRVVEVNSGYLVFSGNDCARFNGTFSCQALGWKNVKINGAKLMNKTRECPMEWIEIGEE